ncbi:Zinc finger protein [Armadillidium nasatum]|uniref:Zinc finger protein n=1 Tax=Armadillidium nasatum TaxID=96803 RepID=A0A5N5TDN9_9CRUS|nr:Zinc finger protein [Armadillidium nasatum]
MANVAKNLRILLKLNLTHVLQNHTQKKAFIFYKYCEFILWLHRSFTYTMLPLKVKKIYSKKTESISTWPFVFRFSYFKELIFIVRSMGGETGLATVVESVSRISNRDFLNMTNAYLALRWNNHNTIFTKVLNHLREQGEVHVPQSELGSLLRTAEALQVKGLAVPDDTTQSPKKSPTSSDSTPTVPLLKSFPVKRKKTTEGNRQEDLPKLTPSQALSATKVKSKSTKNLSSLPVLKRFKASFEENAGHNTSSTSNPGENNANVNHNCNSNSQSSEEPSSENRESVMSTGNSQEQNGLIPISMIKEEVLESNCDEEQPLEEEEENTSFDQENDGEGQYYIDEEEDEQGADGQDGAIEGDENSSLPNSELSTSNIMGDNFLQTELLQVDLSEDGTQFIIGPGVIGGEASRVSSAAEEETEGPKKPFLCVLCGHTFTRRDNLANHLKTHTGERPYMCPYCQKCFSRKDYLKQHERIHTGEKPYSCSICGRAFTRKEGLTDHIRCHSDFKEFSCETCGKSFKQKCGLRFHKRNYIH